MPLAVDQARMKREGSCQNSVGMHLARMGQLGGTFRSLATAGMKQCKIKYHNGVRMAHSSWCLRLRLCYDQPPPPLRAFRVYCISLCCDYHVSHL